jgi:hypothetical protein
VETVAVTERIEAETEEDVATTVETVVVTEIIEAETVADAATTVETVVVTETIEAEIVEDAATTVETVVVTETIEAETVEDAATTVETVAVTEIIEAETEADIATTVETEETAVANVVAIEEIAVIIEAVIEVGSATGETEMVEKRRATIRKRRSQIIHSTKKETINSQRVKPHSEQYFSPLLSSLFMEYFLHSGHGGNPVLVFFTLRNLRRICNLGQPFFGLRTFGILSPYLDVASSFIKSSNQIRGY